MKNGKIENVIYIVTNATLPGYVKIGYAQDLKQRVASLNTGTITDFQPYAVLESDKQNADKEIHGIISLLNPILQATKYAGNGKTKQKEFFRLEPEEAFRLFRHIAEIWGKPDKAYRVTADYRRMDSAEPPVSPEDASPKAPEEKNGGGKESRKPETSKHPTKIRFSESGEEVPFDTYKDFFALVCRKCVGEYGIDAFKRFVLDDENKIFHTKKRDTFSDDLQFMKGKEFGTCEVLDGLFMLTNYSGERFLRLAEALFSEFPKAKAEIFG